MARHHARAGAGGPPILGVLMLETRFPRVSGDIGCAATFAFPVAYRVVAGASPRRVVVDAGGGLLAAFVAAARELESLGVHAVTTSCGFLALFQAELQAAVQVPVWTSSLLLVDALQTQLSPGRKVGIVTADAASLTARHLVAAGAPIDTPREGLAVGSAFRRTLLDDLPELEVAEAEAETVAAARRLVAVHPGIGAIVLECTNLPPYADAVRAATGLPVHDITTLIAARLPALAAARAAEASTA